MGKKDEYDPNKTSQRAGAHRADGWTNPRDKDDDGPTHDDTRLTHHERYGVTYGNHGK